MAACVKGQLLYFYYWIFAVLFVSLRDISAHPSVFSPSFRSDAAIHEALVLAIFPRLLVYLAVAAVAVILLNDCAYSSLRVWSSQVFQSG
jgi:hypothetical protein